MADATRVATSLDEWSKAKRHYVTLNSGSVVGIEIPDLPKMIKTGAIPNNLMDAALGAIQKQEITADLIKEQSDFFYLLVATMVKEPEVSVEDLEAGKIPFEDIELLVEIGTRQRDYDAIFEQISGLHTNERWKRFRGWDDLDTDVENL